MKLSIGEALLFKFSPDSDGAAVAGMVATADGMLTVGGTVGTIPAKAAQRIISLARAAGVDVRRVGGGMGATVMALSFGEIDWDALYPTVVMGISESMTAAIMMALGPTRSDVDQTDDDGDGEVLPF
jgi:hypothetical protein